MRRKIPKKTTNKTNNPVEAITTIKTLNKNYYMKGI